MNHTEPSAHLPRVGLTVLRGVALVGLAALLTLCVDLLLLAFLPQSHGMFGRFMQGRGPSVEAGLPVAIALLALSFFAVFAAIRLLQLRTVRGWVGFGVIVVMALFANLEVVALFPSVLDGYSTLAAAAFWQAHGLSLALIGLTIVAIGYATWRVRPRSARGFVVLGLLTAMIVTFDLVVVAFCPPLVTAFVGLPDVLFSNAPPETLQDLELVVVLAGVLPGVVLAGLWCLQRHSWWWIGGGYLAVAPALAYLALDEPAIRRPLTFAEFSPVFPGATESYDVLMRYGSRHPLGRGFRAPGRIYEKIAPNEAIAPGEPDKWLAWLTTHRRAIETDWAELAPVRAWWAELAAFERIGDLTPGVFDMELVAFSPVRAMTQHACAVASLQALDGHGDEAIETLLPLLQVGRRLQPAARTLVRQMVAIIVERMSVQTASFVLDHADVSPSARARLAAALAAQGGGTEGARRLMAAEYALALSLHGSSRLGDMARERPVWVRQAANIISPFVFNRRATLNRFGQYATDVEELLASRHLEQLDARCNRLFDECARPRIKNQAGRLLLSLAVPAFVKVGETYWNTQDIRAALLTRLTKT